MHVARVSVAFARVALTDAHRQLAIGSELEDLIVVDGLQAGDAVGWAVVASDPNEAFGVHVDAVLSLRPLRTDVLGAPRLDELASRVEHDHGRRRCLSGLDRPRPMQEPYVVFVIDRETRGVAEFPLRRHLRPRLVHFEFGQVLQS